MKILIISPWFGAWPRWHRSYFANVKRQPFDWLFPHDLPQFRRRVKRKLGINPAIRAGTGKIHDFRPAFGEIYAKEIEGYDFWGHTDLDCVYGRLGHFYNDELLAELDLYSDSPGYVGGPWTLYRNTADLRSLYRDSDAWRDILEDDRATGWIEDDYSALVDRSDLRVRYEVQHGYNDVAFLRMKRGRLLHWQGKEIPFFHFRWTKRWPLARASQI